MSRSGIADRREVVVKLARIWISSVVLVGALGAPEVVQAQRAAMPSITGSMDAPNIAGGEDMPWNRGVAGATRAQAREVFLEGNRLFLIPLFSQAVEKYGEAIDAWKHPAFYFNLAIAEINLGRYLEARDHLVRAMEYGPDPLRADRFAEAKKQLVEVEHHLGRIRVRCPTRDAEVTMDGVTLFTGPGDRDIWVTPRAHEVTGKKPDYATQARRVSVAAGAVENVDLSLRKLVEDRPWAVWKPWAVVATGAVIAGSSGVLHAVSARDFDTYDTGFVKLPCAALGCTRQQIDDGDPHLRPQLDRAQREQRIAVGGYLAGGAIIAAGVVLLYRNRPHVMERDDSRPASAGITVAPLLSTDAVGVQVAVSR
jgi:tetratricopeptide (TPR) repeat protein